MKRYPLLLFFFVLAWTAVAQSREPEAQRRAVEHLRGIESRNAAAAKRLLEI